MVRNLLLGAVLLASPLAGFAEDEPKTISGMSIMGNDETPKSLYIVPWKSSEIEGGEGLSSSLLDDDMGPVDKEVFMREVEFHELTNEQ